MCVTKMQAGVVAQTALLHGANRHAVFAERRRDRAEHAGTIGHLGEEVELRRDVVDRADGLARQGADRGALPPFHEVLRGVDEVAEHRRCRRCATGAASVEHQLADRVSLDEHRVERVAYRRERMQLRHHRGVNPHRDLTVDLLRNCEELHDVTEVARRRDVVGRYAGDALAIHVGGDDARPEGNGGDDRSLGRRVVALDVGSGIRLGEPERLRVGERGVERLSAVAHAAEDVVRRAVHDSHDPTNAVAGERLAQWPHERDAATDGGLEQQVDTRTLRRLEQLAPVRGEQLLVGRDHRLACHQCLDDEGSCRLDATDDLDDDVDVGVTDHRIGVVGEAAGREREPAVLREVANRDADHLERYPGPRLDHVGMVVDEPHECAAHVAATEQPDPHPLLHHASVLPGSTTSRDTRSSSVSRRTTRRAPSSPTNTTAGRGTRL